jgi:hypothetical protein
LPPPQRATWCARRRLRRARVTRIVPGARRGCGAGRRGPSYGPTDVATGWPRGRLIGGAVRGQACRTRSAVCLLPAPPSPTPPASARRAPSHSEIAKEVSALPSPHACVPPRQGRTVALQQCLRAPHALPRRGASFSNRR